MGLFGSRKKDSDNRNYDLFEKAQQQAGENVQILLRKSDLYPVHISSNFERVMGVAPARLIDDVETLFRFAAEDDYATHKRQAKNWDGLSPLQLEATYLAPTTPQQKKRLRVDVCPVLNGDYFFATITDITAEYGKVESLEKQRDKAVAAVRDRADFMSQMSHEIRTPLNGIKGMIALAQQHCSQEERLLDDLSRASDLSDYLLSLVNDVLDMSRLNSGHVELEQRPFDLRLVAKELRTMFEGQASDKGLAFTVEAEECNAVFLQGDRMRLNQILVNFVSNALKFTDKGGQVSVTFREMYRTTDEVNYMIRVRDTGKGMDPRFVSRIFKPFEQEDRTIARRYGGTGLGMAITNALVNLMNGKIVVDTEIGHGTDFTVYIPFKTATAAQTEELAEKGETLETYHGSKRDTLEYEFKGKHFLMAEDNDLNALITTEVLRNLGTTVDVANDGPVVVKMFAESKPGTYDAILMDIQMPTFSGWEAARRIRALPRDDAQIVPIIALSANNYVEDARNSRAAGMNGHTGKPIEIAELKAQLAAAEAESAYIREK